MRLMASITTRSEVMNDIKGPRVYTIDAREKTVVGGPPSVTKLPEGIRYAKPDPPVR